MSPLLRHRAWKIALGVCAWTAIGLFFCSGSYLYMLVRGTHPQWGTVIRENIAQWYIWGLLSPFIAWSDRRFAARHRQLYRRLLVHVPMGAFWTIAFLLLSHTVNGLRTRELVYSWPIVAKMFGGTFHWGLLVYAAIAGSYLAWDYYRESREREVKTARLERLLAEARLEALRAQLNPHFLFNALNAISAYVEREPRRARQMIEHLGDFLRYALDHSASQETTLADELDLMDHYLAIQRARFEDRLEVAIDAAPDTLQAHVPALILQPLVENAVVHGIAPRTAAGLLAISARRENGTLELVVRDNGPGLPADWKAGVGLRNTEQRLEQLYGRDYRFAVTSAPGGGVEAAVSIPYHDEQD